MSATEMLDHADHESADWSELAESSDAPRPAARMFRPVAVRFDDRLAIDDERAIGLPAEIAAALGPLLALFDGRTVAAILADSPFHPPLALKIIDRLCRDRVACDPASLRRQRRTDELAPLMPEEPAASPMDAATLPDSALPAASAVPVSIAGTLSDAVTLPVQTTRLPEASPSVIIDLGPPAEAAPALIAPAATASEAATTAATTTSTTAQTTPVAPLLPVPPAAMALPVELATASASVFASFTDLEERFFASEAAEILEARALAEAGDLFESEAPRARTRKPMRRRTRATPPHAASRSGRWSKPAPAATPRQFQRVLGALRGWLGR